MPLTDEQWAVIQPLLPPPSPACRGRPPHAGRNTLDAILWKIRTGSPWYDLPSGFPSWQTCYRRFHYWQHQGVLSAIITALDHDLRDRSGFDFRLALASRRIRFTPVAGQVQVIFDSSLQDLLYETWQLETVYLLLAVLFKAIRRKLPAQRLRLTLPVLIAPLPVPSSKIDA
jgi:transposase